MIRGIGVYVDGSPHVPAHGHLTPEATFGEGDLDVLRSMWTEAKGGGSDSFVWLGLRDPAREEIDLVASVFGIDGLQVDDSLSIRQRAHLEVRDDRVFAVVKVLGYIEETSDVETAQIAVWVGDSYVLTVRIGDVGDLTGLRAALETDPQQLALGPLAVLHGVLDIVVDGYQVVVDELAVDISQVEERVFSPERTDDAALIYKLKRENLEVRRAVDPLRTTALRLLDHELVEVPTDLRPYFHDLGDHILRVSDLSAQHDVLLGTVLEAARSRQAVQQNDDMRKISAWVAIAAVPTMIAGIYGMNFDFMPELHWELGYYGVLALMLTVCFLLYRAFKRSGWL
ncbi:MAG: magnesium and cobalt transport protein CorA [Candidatus Nanopelagicales bacterium]